MIDFLAKVLGPVFVNYGVSEADFQAYLTQLSGYVYFTLALLAALVIALVLAQKAKKGFRHVVRWSLLCWKTVCVPLWRRWPGPRPRT